MKEAAKKKLSMEKEEVLKMAPKGKEDIVRAQYDMLFSELFDMIDNNESLAENILQEHKTFKRCYKFMEDKAKSISSKEATSALVTSDTLFAWLEEYYALDDAAQIKAEEEKKAQMEKERVEREERLKQLRESKEKAGTTANPSAPATNKKKSKKEDPNQLSLFDMMAG